MKAIKLKKILGWILALIGLVLLTLFLSERTNLKQVLEAYVCAILTISFMVLVVWLIVSEE